MKYLLVNATITSLALSACTVLDLEPAEYARPQAQSSTEITFAKEILNTYQALSIQKNREYCGYIGLNEEGSFITSKIQKGRKGSCHTSQPSDEMDILASFHTHGGYTEDYDSEVPSSDDIKSDREEGLDGYVATPGGRLWYIDTLKNEVRQLCGIGCLISDDNFVIGDYGTVQQQYSPEDIINREQEE